MTSTLWILIALQAAMGAFDTLFHHEGTERLAWRPGQTTELKLHGVRNLIYALIFLTIAWFEPHGAFAALLAMLLLVELIITLWDFVEEDRSRKLPATERVLHTLLTLNYGLILALLAPVILGWAEGASRIVPADNGLIGWGCTLAALGVFVFGLRDLAAARRAPRLKEGDPAGLVSMLDARRHILVTGGTGFIGSRLVAALAGAGHDVTVLTRSPETAASLAAPIRIVTALNQISGTDRIDAIVHLAGEPISNALWTVAKRRRVIRSRVKMTQALLSLVARLERRPDVFISASAIGWYGLRKDEFLTELSDARPCFSHRSCEQAERAGRRASALGIRHVQLRTGLVLAASGGLLARMLTPFEFGLGGPFGKGEQWMSWIHRDDMVRLIAHAIADEGLSGPLNACAPTPVRNREFTAALGQALRRPAFLAIPGRPLQLALGDFATELLLGGQRVLPQAAVESGFQFRYPLLSGALAAIIPTNEEPKPTPGLKTAGEPAR